MREPHAGDILVASPMLSDPNFMRTVVYLLEHNPDGTLGLVLNRVLPMPIGQLWDECPQGLKDLPLCAEGGPVDRGRGLLLHGCTDLHRCYNLGIGLAIGGDTEALRQHWPHGANDQGPRLFLGHSGWAPNQLLDEIGVGSWLVHAGHPSLALNPEPPEDMWQELICTGGELPDPSPS